MIHLHGWPSSRLEQFAEEALLERLGLDWFSLDRPGYGESGFDPKHSLADWPLRVAAWADEQGIGDFHVLGFSGGGPYAMACAALLGQRVRSLTLIGSLAPFGRGAVGCRPPWGFWGGLVLRHAPLLGVAGMKLADGYRRRAPQAFERNQLPFLPPADRKVLENAERQHMLMAAHAEACRQGVRHLVHDLGLAARPWPFDVCEIGCRVRLLVGDQDGTVPPECSRWLAQQIPGAELTVFPGEGHYIPYTQTERILQPLSERG